MENVTYTYITQHKSTYKNYNMNNSSQTRCNVQQELYWQDTNHTKHFRSTTTCSDRQPTSTYIM
jgi:hypothetical protein